MAESSDYYSDEFESPQRTTHNDTATIDQPHSSSSESSSDHEAGDVEVPHNEAIDPAAAREEEKLVAKMSASSLNEMTLHPTDQHDDFHPKADGNYLGGTTTAHSSNSATFNATIAGTRSPLRASNLSKARMHNKERPLTKLQRYAVEEGLFAPVHAKIDDGKLNKLMTRLYDPEPLRRRTLLDVQDRRVREEERKYDSLQDAHLAEYWQKKQMKRVLTSGDRLPALGRPSTCPPDVTDGLQVKAAPSPFLQKPHKSKGSHHPPRSSTAQKYTTPSKNRDGRHHSPSGALRSCSQSSDDSFSLSTSSRGSSPDWKEQRANRSPSPERQKRQARQEHRHRRPGTQVLAPSFLAHVGEMLSDGEKHSRDCFIFALFAPRHSTERQRQRKASESPNSAKKGELVPVSNYSSSQRSARENLANIKRKDLTALWMAARPPSSFQRLVSKLSINPKEDFKLQWLFQKKPPPAGGTLESVPKHPPPSSDLPVEGFKISSPRSAYVMLRCGLTPNDLVPVPLDVFYLEGSLKGLPRHVSEVHFAARERQRQKLLDNALAEYRNIGSVITQEEFVAKLYETDPESHREVLLSRETDSVCRAANREERQAAADAEKSVASADDDAAAARRRVEIAMEKQQCRQDKYMEQLHRNKTLLVQRTDENKKREEKARQKHERLVEKRRQEQLRRQEEQQRRKEKLQRIKEEAEAKERQRQQSLLQRIQAQEDHCQQLNEERRKLHLLKQEELKIVEEGKEEQVLRREKQLDYENLLIIDRIRRKVGRANAMQEIKEKAMIELKNRREKNFVDMAIRTETFTRDLLEYQRKNLDN